MLQFCFIMVENSKRESRNEKVALEALFPKV